MVSYRKPEKRSEYVIDRRVVRSPRGTTPLSAAAMFLREEQRFDRLVAEANRQAAELIRRRGRRS